VYQPSTLRPGIVNPAEWFQERLEKEITKAQNALQDGQVLDVIVILRDGSKLWPTWFGYWGPDMIRVEGTNEHGREVEVVMHYSAMEVVIGAADAPPGGGAKKRAIGFQAPEK